MLKRRGKYGDPIDYDDFLYAANKPRGSGFGL